MTLVLFPLIWGTLADRFQIRKPIYILCNVISTSTWIFFLFTVKFWPMLIITVFYGMFYAPIISFLEAVTMDVLDAEKKSYGRIRVWGSISFIIVVLVMGKIIDVYSVDIILVLVLAGSLMLAVISPQIPATKALKTVYGFTGLWHPGGMHHQIHIRAADNQNSISIGMLDVALSQTVGNAS